MITAIGMIKNAADIIESYIRCNAAVCDNFVLLDNMSTDNTVRILEALRDEGFAIEIIEDSESSYQQSLKMTRLLHYVIDNYNSDFIIPLDDDEIISSETMSDVKSAIEGLGQDKIYFYKWRNYVPTEEDDPDDTCTPHRMNYCFGRNMKTLIKLILPGEIARRDRPSLTMGNHNVEGTEAEKTLLKNIFLAHYPVRSQEQIKSKALVGFTNLLAQPFRRACDGFHWEKIYNMIKEGGEISLDMMWEICGMYMLSMDDLELEMIPMNLPSECFELRYTGDNEIDPMKNYMENVETMARKYAGLLEKQVEV